MLDAGWWQNCLMIRKLVNVVEISILMNDNNNFSTVMRTHILRLCNDRVCIRGSKISLLIKRKNLASGTFKMHQSNEEVFLQLS